MPQFQNCVALRHHFPLYLLNFANEMKKIFFLILVTSLAVFQTISAATKYKIAPSYAWTMLEPLGLREPATIDTSLINYSRRSVPGEVSMAYATTGNLGSPGQNMIIFDRRPASNFFFRDALSAWLPELSNHAFYNTRIPMTLVSYNTGGTRDDAQDRLSIDFSGNVDERLQIGAMVDYLYSKGSYDNQAAKHLSWGLSGSYISPHYDLQAFFNHYNSVNKENGGITNDLYITRPEELQGGNSSINPKSIPTFLNSAHSRIVGQEFLMNHRYKLGFFETLPPNDTIPNDTVERRQFVPVMSFIWTCDYIDSRHVFDNQNASQDNDFWENHYITAGHTHDKTSYWSLRNTIGVSLLEGFNKYAKAGLSAFVTHEFLRYNQTPDTIAISGDERPTTLTPYPLDSKLEPHATENRLWAGAQLTKQQGSWVRYEATGRVGLIGRTAADLQINGNASLRLPLMRDTLAVTAYGDFANSKVPYLLEKYVSNHFIWDNDFSKTRRLKLGGRLDYPKSRTHLDIGVENIENWVYFNEQAMPAQHDGNIQLFSATLAQDLRLGIFNWENRVTYQTTSNDNVLPLPKLAIYSNAYIFFTVAKVLKVQLGVDCDYYTRYYAPDYQPATMAFVNQRTTMVGNYAFMNAYANFKLKRARFYVMFSHVNQGLFGNDYFSMPHYPLNPRRFQMGVSVDFAN